MEETKLEHHFANLGQQTMSGQDIAARLGIQTSGNAGHMARILQMRDGQRLAIVGIADENGKGFILRGGNPALLEKAREFAKEDEG